MIVYKINNIKVLVYLETLHIIIKTIVKYFRSDF